MFFNRAQQRVNTDSNIEIIENCGVLIVLKYLYIPTTSIYNICFSALVRIVSLS